MSPHDPGPYLSQAGPTPIVILANTFSFHYCMARRSYVIQGKPNGIHRTAQFQPRYYTAILVKDSLAWRYQCQRVVTACVEKCPVMFAP